MSEIARLIELITDRIAELRREIDNYNRQGLSIYKLQNRLNQNIELKKKLLKK
jgi:hypothetical protein